MREQESLLAQGPDDPDDDAALRARLGQLSSSLKTQDNKRPKPAPMTGDTGLSNGMAMGFRAVTELVAGVVVGGGIGYLLDKAFHTKPLLLVLCLVLGLIGGFWNIVRTTLVAPKRPGDGI